MKTGSLLLALGAAVVGLVVGLNVYYKKTYG